MSYEPLRRKRRSSTVGAATTTEDFNWWEFLQNSTSVADARIYSDDLVIDLEVTGLNKYQYLESRKHLGHSVPDQFKFILIGDIRYARIPEHPEYFVAREYPSVISQHGYILRSMAKGGEVPTFRISLRNSDGVLDREIHIQYPVLVGMAWPELRLMITSYRYLGVEYRSLSPLGIDESGISRDGDLLVFSKYRVKKPIEKPGEKPYHSIVTKNKKNGRWQTRKLTVDFLLKKLWKGS